MNALDQVERKLQDQLAALHLEQAHLEDQLLGSDTFKRRLVVLLDIPESEPDRYNLELRGFIETITVTHGFSA